MATGYCSKDHVQLLPDNSFCNSAAKDQVMHWNIILVHQQVTARKEDISLYPVDNEKAVCTAGVVSLKAIDHIIFLLYLFA